MIRVIALNTKTGFTGGGKFATQELADAWIVDQKNALTYGHGERQMTAEYAAIYGLNVADATASEVNEDGQTLYTFPPEWDFVITDISAEVAAENVVIGVMNDQEKGKEIKARISALLRVKLATGQITLEELGTFVESDAVKKVERYLSEGYLTLVVPIISGSSFNLLTQEEKDSFLAELA